MRAAPLTTRARRTSQKGAFRIVLPLIRSRRHALVVRDVVAQSPDVVSVVLEGSAASAVAAPDYLSTDW